MVNRHQYPRPRARDRRTSAMYSTSSSNSRNPPPPMMVDQHSGNPCIRYNSNLPPTDTTLTPPNPGNPRNPMYNHNPPPPWLARNRGPINLFYNPRNWLATNSASRRNIWRSNYRRRNQLSHNNFTHNRDLSQSFSTTHCSNGQQSTITCQRHSQPDNTRVIQHANRNRNRNNSRQLYGTRGCGRFNHSEGQVQGGRRFRNSQPYTNRNNPGWLERNNPRWLGRQRYHNSIQNNSSNLFHNIHERDDHLAQDRVDFNDYVAEEGADIDPLPERDDHLSEDRVNFNDDMSEESPEDDAHADWNCQDPSLTEAITEEDVATNQISANRQRQGGQADLTVDQGIPYLDHQTLTEAITHQDDEHVDLAQRPFFRFFRETNTSSPVLYLCFRINEALLATYHDEYVADGQTEVDAEEEENEIQANNGLSEEEISEKLKIGIHETDGHMEGEAAICVICQTQYEKEETTGSLQCGHEYHVECIKKWLLLKSKCPVCFGDV